MMMTRYFLWIFSLIIFCAACKPQKLTTKRTDNKTYAEFVVEEALMTCFDEGMQFPNGNPYNCEFSAVANMGEQLIFGNDKNIEATSPVFLSNTAALENETQEGTEMVDKKPFYQIRKIEDFAYSIDRKTLFTTSGFDRLKDDSNEWDAYNSLLAWNIKGDYFQMIGGIVDGEITSSKEYRYDFLELLNSQHMKIEGLMVLPGNRIVFGVREMGESYQDPIYTSTFIECTYEKDEDEIKITSPFKIKYRLSTDVARDGLGLSSLYYDAEGKCIYMTASFEDGEEGNQELGGYIFSLSLTDYEIGAAAKLIRKKDGSPFALRHKVEGITRLNNGNFFIIYDNDRTDVPVHLSDGTTVSRANNEAVYSIVKLP